MAIKNDFWENGEGKGCFWNTYLNFCVLAKLLSIGRGLYKVNGILRSEFKLYFINFAGKDYIKMNIKKEQTYGCWLYYFGNIVLKS